MYKSSLWLACYSTCRLNRCSRSRRTYLHGSVLVPPWLQILYPLIEMFSLVLSLSLSLSFLLALQLISVYMNSPEC